MVDYIINQQIFILFSPPWDINTIDPHQCLVWPFAHMTYYEQWDMGGANTVPAPKESCKRH